MVSAAVGPPWLGAHATPPGRQRASRAEGMTDDEKGRPDGEGGAVLGKSGLDPAAFQAAVQMTRMRMVLVDPSREDCPVVYCNGAFCEMTGYDQEEVVGRNCRFLQGPDTDAATVRRIA